MIREEAIPKIPSFQAPIHLSKNRSSYLQTLFVFKLNKKLKVLGSFASLLNGVNMTHYRVGYYKPTFEFRQITEFMAIFASDERLVGLTGPSINRQAAIDAKLLAAAPELLLALKTLCQQIEQALPNPDIKTKTTTQELSTIHITELMKAVQSAKTLIGTLEHGRPSY